MSLRTAKAFTFKLVCNGVQLDTFQDEEITISDNVTGLFDVGELPSDFTRQILLPGTKKNNAFFEHVYDISITNPYLWKTNVKVEAYFDFDGIYVSQGYLQLNSINLFENANIESYEVTIFGLLSSFARDINKNFLTDLSTLSIYNHTSSLFNIKQSWNGSDGGLFDGDIVYPMVDYGKNIKYQEGFKSDEAGINSFFNPMTVQDFKPAIRVKKVFDAIFNQFGYNYESQFMSSSFLDNVYMICDNGLETPFYAGFGDNGLDTFGQVTIGSVTGSTITALAQNTFVTLPVSNIEFDPNNTLSLENDGTGDKLFYNSLKNSNYEGKINLSFKVYGTEGVPQFSLRSYYGTGSLDYVPIPFAFNNINRLLREENSQNASTGEKSYNIEETFITDTQLFEPGYWFKIGYTQYNGSLFDVDINPTGEEKTRFQITNVLQAADFRIMDIPSNMPYGEIGIKCIDFIKGLQKKYNLVIYPSKTKPKTFIVETFNDWYKTGEIRDFNKYINVKNKITVTPANNLAVNQLNFQDKLDNDYISQQFKKEQNREYGKQYYQDTTNFFSQGKFEVETTFSSSPLRYIPGTGITGSAVQNDCYEYEMFCPSSPDGSGCDYSYINCAGVSTFGTLIPDSNEVICARAGTTPILIGGVIYNTGLICTGSI